MHKHHDFMYKNHDFMHKNNNLCTNIIMLCTHHDLMYKIMILCTKIIILCTHHDAMCKNHEFMHMPPTSWFYAHKSWFCVQKWTPRDPQGTPKGPPRGPQGSPGLSPWTLRCWWPLLHRSYFRRSPLTKIIHFQTIKHFRVKVIKKYGGGADLKITIIILYICMFSRW